MIDDEIAAFRALRSEAEPYGFRAKSRARTRMLDGHVPSRRPRWAIAGVIAATGAVLATSLLLFGGTDKAPPPLVRPMSAAEYLEKAAQTVERQPEPRLDPHRWLYTKTAMKDNDSTSTQSHETWMRLDGKWGASPNGPDGKISLDKQYPGKDDETPLRRYAVLRTLPTDPHELRDWAYGTVDERRAKRKATCTSATTPDSRHQAAYNELSRLFDQMLTPPSLHAAAFRAIALIPDVQVLHGASDLLGRSVTSIVRVDENGRRHEIMVDPVTYVYRAWGTVIVRNDGKPLLAGTCRGANGTPTPEYLPPPPLGRSHHEAVEASAIVDKAGGR